MFLFLLLNTNDYLLVYMRGRRPPPFDVTTTWQQHSTTRATYGHHHLCTQRQLKLEREKLNREMEKVEAAKAAVRQNEANLNNLLGTSRIKLQEDKRRRNRFVL